jgi:hypothetical protein
MLPNELLDARNRFEAELADLRQAQLELTAREEKWAADQKAAHEVWAARIEDLERRSDDLIRREAQLASAETGADEEESVPSYFQRFNTPPSDDGDEDGAEADLAAQSAARFAAPASSGHGEEEDQSIEQYMNALLNRVGGHSAATGSGPTTNAATYTSQSPQSPRNASAKPSDSQPAPTLVTQRVQRKAAPENTNTMAAMRELANLSTRVALDRHGKTRQLASAWIKAIVAAAAFATSIHLAHSASRPSLLGPYGVALTFVIGAVYALLFVQMITRRSQSKKSIQALLAHTASKMTDDTQSHPT